MIQTFLGRLAEHPAMQLLATIILVLGAVALVLAAFLLVYHAVTSRRRARRRGRVEGATRFLGPCLVDRQCLPARVTEARQRWGDWAVAVVLREARAELQGPSAAHITSQLESMGEIGRLEKLARSRHPWKRLHACRALGECGGASARAALVRATGDSRLQVRRAAREGLLAEGSREAVDTAIASYSADTGVNGSWKRTFFTRLAVAGPDRLRQLVESSRLPAEEVKLALEALGDVQDREALPILRQRLGSRDPEIRASAARAMGKIGEGVRAAELTPLLDDPEWFVRAAAALAFERITASPEELELLAERLHDHSWWVRHNAAQALVAGGERGVDALLHEADGEDPFAWDASLSALALGFLLPQERAQLQPAAEKLLDDPNAESLRPLVEATTRLH